MTNPGTLDPVRGSFRAVATACVPAAAELTPGEWTRGEAIVDEALAQRPASVRRQLVLFVRILGVLSLLRFGRGLARLDPARTLALLRGLERSPLLLLRRGVWGVRTLAFMACYAQAGARRRIGYAASPSGWEARGGVLDAWPYRGGAAPPESYVLTRDPEPPDRA